MPKKKTSSSRLSKAAGRAISATTESKKKIKEELGEDLTMKESEDNQKKLAPHEEL